MNQNYSSKSNSSESKSSFIDRNQMVTYSYNTQQKNKILDTQRQVSNSKMNYKHQRIQRKLNNSGWTAHMIRQYKAIVNHDLTNINQVQRYGIPKALTYVVETYNKIHAYIKAYPNTRQAKSAVLIEKEVERTTNRFISKVERYGLHVKPQEYSHEAQPKVNKLSTNEKQYNAERMHISLENVL